MVGSIPTSGEAGGVLFVIIELPSAGRPKAFRIRCIVSLRVDNLNTPSVGAALRRHLAIPQRPDRRNSSRMTHSPPQIAKIERERGIVPRIYKVLTLEETIVYTINKIFSKKVQPRKDLNHQLSLTIDQEFWAFWLKPEGDEEWEQRRSLQKACIEPCC